jgi:hypothetical protein
MRIWINTDELENHGIDLNDPNFSEIAVNYLQDNYFNGADNAVIYMGEFKTLGVFEFELIPG